MSHDSLGVFIDLLIRILSLDVVKDLEARDPQAFDQKKGNLRVNTITGISFNLGLMFGPLLAGTLVETVGYPYMIVAIGESCYKSDLMWLQLLISIG